MRTPSLMALLAILSVIGCNAAYSQQQNIPKGEFSAHRVAGSVYMIDKGTSDSDGGGNMAVLVGSDGLVLVDAKGEPWHQMVVAALKQLSDRPVRYVIDTHCHGDHTWGNAAFQREGATIIAHRNVREKLAAQSYCGPRPGTGLPTLTFDRELTLYVDDEEIRIIKLPLAIPTAMPWSISRKPTSWRLATPLSELGLSHPAYPGHPGQRAGTW